jgi:hypothetical protein
VYNSDNPMLDLELIVLKDEEESANVLKLMKDKIKVIILLL